MEKNNKKALQLEKAIYSFRGQKCWSVIAGAGSGSIISLAFGSKLRRIKSLRNKNLTDEQRNFDGEFELYVECAWRLQTGTSVICTSTSSNQRGDTMTEALDLLIGQVVVGVELTYPAGDIKIDFEDGFSLVIFADQANEADEYCNYTVSANSEIIINGAKSEISLHERLPLFKS